MLEVVVVVIMVEVVEILMIQTARAVVVDLLIQQILHLHS